MPAPLFWANTLMCGVAIAIAVWSVVQLQESERETRMLEYYVMESDHKLVQHGIMNPEDTWSAQKAKR